MTQSHNITQFSRLEAITHVKLPLPSTTSFSVLHLIPTCKLKIHVRILNTWVVLVRQKLSQLMLKCMWPNASHRKKVKSTHKTEKYMCMQVIPDSTRNHHNLKPCIYLSLINTENWRIVRYCFHQKRTARLIWPCTAMQQHNTSVWSLIINFQCHSLLVLRKFSLAC